MAESNKTRRVGAVKKREAYWQTDWITRVLSNGHNPQAKLLFMRIASFGEKGCWMNNETFSDEFNRSERTIRRAITSLWSKGDVIVTGWNGHGRTVYAAGHPKVEEELNRRLQIALQKGKIKTKEEYTAKIRQRRKAPVETVEVKVKRVSRLEYYKARRKEIKE